MSSGPCFEGTKLSTCTPVNPSCRVAVGDAQPRCLLVLFFEFKSLEPSEFLENRASN